MIRLEIRITNKQTCLKHVRFTMIIDRNFILSLKVSPSFIQPHLKVHRISTLPSVYSLAGIRCANLGDGRKKSHYCYKGRPWRCQKILETTESCIFLAVCECVWCKNACVNACVCVFDSCLYMFVRSIMAIICIYCKYDFWLQNVGVNTIVILSIVLLIWSFVDNFFVYSMHLLT